MKKVLLTMLTILLLSTPSYAEYVVKLNTDITKFDDSNCILGSWFILDNIDDIDAEYIQENYTYTTCESTGFNVCAPILLTETDMAKLHPKTPQKSVNVAIIDTGIDLKNEALKTYILGQYNVINGTTDVQDDCGHGTHIAGIITSISNNKILPVKVLDSKGIGKSADIAVGIKWATDEGAKIINLSLGGTKYDQLMKEAIDYAVEKGCIVVCASGNTYGEREIYPACLPNTISVGSIDKDGAISKFSNSGDRVDIYAIGNTKSIDLNGEYKERNGTSMACAIVSAELSIIF